MPEASLPPKLGKAWMAKKREELLAQAGDVVKAAQAADDFSNFDLAKYVVLILGAVSILVIGVAYGLIWYLDDYAPSA